MNKQIVVKEDIFSKWKSPDLSVETKVEEVVSQEEVGYETGYQAGLAQGKAEVQSQIDLMTQYLDTLSRVFDDQNQDLAEHLVKLAGDIAKAIVKKELSIDPELILTIVRDSVSALNGNISEISIHLNPVSASYVRNLINQNEKERYWKIIEDPMVDVMDCKIHSKHSLIDSDIDSRIELIINKLLEDSRNQELK